MDLSSFSWVSQAIIKGIQATRNGISRESAADDNEFVCADLIAVSSSQDFPQPQPETEPVHTTASRPTQPRTGPLVSEHLPRVAMVANM